MENFFFVDYFLPAYSDLKLIFLFSNQTFVFLINIRCVAFRLTFDNSIHLFLPFAIAVQEYTYSPDRETLQWSDATMFSTFFM